MTLKQFQEMAGLISRKEFKRITGLDDEDIRELLKAGTIHVFHRPGTVRLAAGPGRKNKAGQGRGPYGRYYTVEAAKLCGFDLTKG